MRHDRWGTDVIGPTRTLLRGAATLLALAVVALAGCGSSEQQQPAQDPPGLTISGPGLQTSPPPWRPEYAHLQQRMRRLGLPPVGDERYHRHALLRVYIDGLLTPVPTDVGIHHDKGIESSLHTHDGTGVIHMESSRPHRFTLGDFFSVWGVKLGPAQVGALTGRGGDRLHFYLNGRPLRDPAAHVLRDRDVVVIGYGPADNFPHMTSTELLDQLEDESGAALACGKTPAGRRVKSCLAPEADSDDDR